MQKLILLYWGTVFLMYLSQVYFPVDGRPAGRPRRFAAPRADIFMLAAIFWLTCFSFLRTSYNDSPLSSKKQKNNCRQWYPGFGCPFFNSFHVSCLLAAA